MALASIALALAAGCTPATGPGTAAPSVGRVTAATAPAGSGSVPVARSPARPMARSLPVRLRIPSIGVDTST